MLLRKTALALAAVAGLAMGGFTLADNPDAQAAAPPAGAAQDGPAAAGDEAQQQGQAQQQIQQLLAQIAADPKTSADKLFILTAALHNQSELQLAKQVLQKTQNPHVKKLAEQMIQSLEKTHEKVQEVAKALDLQLPQSLAQAAVQEVNIVAALPAEQLDQQYTAAVQADNAEDRSQYGAQAAIAHDARVKDFAKSQGEAIQQRVQDTDEVARGMDMPAGEEARPAGATIKGQSDERR